MSVVASKSRNAHMTLSLRSMLYVPLLSPRQNIWHGTDS